MFAGLNIWDKLTRRLERALLLELVLNIQELVPSRLVPVVLPELRAPALNHGEARRIMHKVITPFILILHQYGRLRFDFNILKATGKK